MSNPQKCHGRPQSQCDTDCLWYQPAWRSGQGYCVRDEDVTATSIQSLCGNLSELDPTLVKALMEDLAAYGVFTSNQVRRFDKMSAAEKCSTLSRGLLSHMFLRQFGRNRDEISERITELRNSWKQWVLGGRLVAEVKTIDQYKRDIDELLARTRQELGVSNDIDALPGAVSLVKELTHPSKASIGKGWWVGGAGAALGTAAFLYYVFGTTQGGQMLDTMKAAAATQGVKSDDSSASITAPSKNAANIQNAVAKNGTIEAMNTAPSKNAANIQNAIAKNAAIKVTNTAPTENTIRPVAKNSVDVMSTTSNIEQSNTKKSELVPDDKAPSNGKGAGNQPSVNETIPSSWFGQIASDPTYLLFTLLKIIGYPMLLALLAAAYSYLELLFPVWLRELSPSGFERPPELVSSEKASEIRRMNPRAKFVTSKPTDKFYSVLVKEKLNNAIERTTTLLLLAEKIMPGAAFRQLKTVVYFVQRSAFQTFRNTLERNTSSEFKTSPTEKNEIGLAIKEIDEQLNTLNVLIDSPSIRSLTQITTQTITDLPDQVEQRGWLKGTWEWAKGLVSSITGQIGENKVALAFLTLMLFSIGAAYLYQQSSGGNATEQGFVQSTASQLTQEQQQQSVAKT